MRYLVHHDWVPARRPGRPAFGSLGGARFHADPVACVSPPDQAPTNRVARGAKLTLRHCAVTGPQSKWVGIAELSGFSRTTLYRNQQLRAIVEEQRNHVHDRRTLTGLSAEIGRRIVLEAVADRVR